MLLDFNLFFENDDDICITVSEVTKRINLCKYVNFSNRNFYGNDGVIMFNLIVILIKSLFGYVSTRNLKKLYQNDIGFMFILKIKFLHMHYFNV